MGGEGIQEHQEIPIFLPSDGAGVGDLVQEAHHRRNGSIIFQVLNVLGDFFDGLMEGRLQLFAVAIPVNDGILQIPDPLQEPLAAPDGVHAPGSRFLKVSHEHLIEPQGIGAVFPDDVVGIDDVSTGFAHLLAVLAQYHAVAGALGVRLLAGNNALIVKELVPEPGVEQMKRRVLHAAVVPVNREPVF